MEETKFADNSMLIMTFISLVILGGILFPTLLILFLLVGLSWIIPSFFMILCLILSLIVSRNIERRERARKIRSGVKSKRTWMSLADYGASYGRIDKKSSKKKNSKKQEEDRWSYLRRILEKSDSEMKFKKI